MMMMMMMMCWTDIAVDRWVISMVQVRARSGWTISTAADQKANLLIVATTAGNGTTVAIVRTSQSAAINGKSP